MAQPQHARDYCPYSLNGPDLPFICVESEAGTLDEG